MFYLQELFDDLAYGEFANMAISDPITGSITVDKYPKIVSYINAGLLDLYSRFRIKTKECLLYQRENKTTYYIRDEHLGDPFAGNPEIYIDGTVDDPPNNDIIRFIEAYDNDANEVHINDARYPEDIFIPEPDVITLTPGNLCIPPVPLKIISLVYQAAYPKIVIDSSFDPGTYKLHFPSFLKLALTAYIASRLFVSKDSQAIEGQPRLSSTFLYRYEAECNKIKSLSLISEISDEAEQFENNGWV